MDNLWKRLQHDFAESRRTPAEQVDEFVEKVRGLRQPSPLKTIQIPYDLYEVCIKAAERCGVTLDCFCREALLDFFTDEERDEYFGFSLLNTEIDRQVDRERKGEA